MIFSFGLSAYGRHTKGELAALIERELSPMSGKDAMEAFMRSHVGAYHLDDRINFEYAGIFKQKLTDKMIFNRKIQVSIKFNPETEKCARFIISVLYTFL